MGANLLADAEAGPCSRWGGRVPIVLGVTGHRNIDPADKKLRAAVNQQCLLLRQRYPYSPFVILSALAEGADRLVAAEAMEVLSADLVAVLPMTAEEYVRDFVTQEAKAAFDALLNRALCVKIAALPDGDPSWQAEGEPRNQQYARAGAIIVDHTQILFAIWDGLPARGTGGTADLVKWFGRGFAPAKYSLYEDAASSIDAFEPGLRIEINPASAKVSVFESSKSRERTGSASSIHTILSRTERYNRDVSRNRGAIAKSEPLDAGNAAKAAGLGVANSVYCAADGMSANFAGAVRKADIIVYSISLLAVTAFNFISEYVFGPWAYLAITLLMALLAMAVWFWSLDNRFLEYRCLAEAMRTLFFWRLAGVGQPAWHAYLSRHPGVVHWIRHAVRSVEFCQDCKLSLQAAGGIPVTADGLRAARIYWVDDQRKWFAKKELVHSRRYKFWGRTARIGIAASFATAALLALLTILPGKSGLSLWAEWVSPQAYGDYWQALLGLLAGGGLAARGFVARRADFELTKHYASQREIFDAASQALDLLESGAEQEWMPEGILAKLGEETLQAQAEWLWLRHSRPFEVPTG